MPPPKKWKNELKVGESLIFTHYPEEGVI